MANFFREGMSGGFTVMKICAILSIEEIMD